MSQTKKRTFEEADMCDEDFVDKEIDDSDICDDAIVDEEEGNEDDEFLEDEEDDEDTTNEVQETDEQQSPADTANTSTSRNTGMKYKKWNSIEEREKYYKRKNYGATISTRKKIGEEKIYPPVPQEGLILPGYEISQFGRIRLQNGNITTGSSENRPSIEFPHYKSYIVSRLVASSFDILKDIEHDVDHIDPSRPLNHSLSNLQSLNRSEHEKKTHRDYPLMASQIQKSLSKPVLGRKLGVDSDFIEYLSSHDAERKTGVDSSNIRTICAKRLKNDSTVYQCGGFEWKYGERYMGEVAPDDSIWKFIHGNDGNLTQHAICQYGLVKRNDGFITRGVLAEGRYIFMKLQVSILVALYFLPPPANANQTTVNHKDLNPLNNHVSNLEWASDREQVLHSLQNNKNRKKATLTKKCRYRAKDSDEWITCNSIVDASKKTGVSVSAIRNNFRREGFCEKGFQFREIPVPSLPGETFVPLRLYYKRPQKERRAPKMLKIIHKDY